MKKFGILLVMLSLFGFTAMGCNSGGDAPEKEATPATEEGNGDGEAPADPAAETEEGGEDGEG